MYVRVQGPLQEILDKVLPPSQLQALLSGPHTLVRVEQMSQANAKGNPEAAAAAAAVMTVGAAPAVVDMDSYTSSKVRMGFCCLYRALHSRALHSRAKVRMGFCCQCWRFAVRDVVPCTVMCMNLYTSSKAWCTTALIQAIAAVIAAGPCTVVDFNLYTSVWAMQQLVCTVRRWAG